MIVMMSALEAQSAVAASCETIAVSRYLRVLHDKTVCGCDAYASGVSTTVPNGHSMILCGGPVHCFSLSQSKSHNQEWVPIQ